MLSTMAWPHPITIIALGSGLLAALVMGTLYNRHFTDAPLPSDVFLARLLGGEPTDHELGGVLLYLGYGAVVGGLFPSVFHGWLGLSGTWITANPYTLATGLAFGLLLLGPWMALRRLGLVDVPFRNRPDGSEDIVQNYSVVVGLHLLFGLVLGFVVGMSDGIWYPLIGL